MTLAIPLQPAPRQLAARPSTTTTVVALVVVAVVDLVLLVHRAMLDVVSPYDEGYHLSYVQYVHGWSIPRVGDPMGSWAEQAYACHPTFPFGPVTPEPCGTDGESSMYPEGGTNTSAIWPPLYYVLAAQVVRLVAVVSDLDPLHSARLASCLLWVAGSALLALLVMRTSGSALLGGAVGVIATANPAAWAIGSYVTPHSAALLIGAVLLAGLLWVAGPRRRSAWAVLWAGLAGVLIGLTVPHAVVGVAAVCVALLLRGLHRRPRSGRLVGTAVALGLSNLVTYVAWTWIVSVRTVGTQVAQPSTGPEGLVAAVRDNWDLFLPRLASEVAFTSPVQNQVAHLMGYAVIAFLGYWLLQRGMPAQRAVALGVLVAAPLGAVAMALQLDYPVPTRYGASLLAPFLFLMALRRRPPWLPAALAVLAVVLVGVTWEGMDSYLFMVV